MTTTTDLLASLRDPQLIAFATQRDLDYMQAIEEHGGIRPAARAIGVASASIDKAIRRLKTRAAAQGYAPEHDMTKVAPAGYKVKGVSTYYNEDGKPVGQWVKTSRDPDAMLEVFREALDGFLDEVPALPAPAPRPTRAVDTDVIPWVQIGDAHIGLLTHAAEVGENFDLRIAEEELCAAIGGLLDELPYTDRLVINDLGDATHYENYSATTEASGHQLDFDSRFPKMIRAYSRIMRFIVDKALTKAQHVDVIVNQGNHSRTNDVWMAELLRVAYDATGRVHVLNNDSVFIGYRMGNTLVMTHHSDKCKPRDLAHVMTHDFRRDYGETEHHYIDIGHIHHGMVMKEHPGVFVESFNHLAATDKWAHEAGYRSRKSITVVLRSRTYGEVGRRVLSIQEIRDRLTGRAVDPSPRAFSV